jgi:hypothetical protein
LTGGKIGPQRITGVQGTVDVEFVGTVELAGCVALGLNFVVVEFFAGSEVVTLVEIAKVVVGGEVTKVVVGTEFDEAVVGSDVDVDEVEVVFDDSAVEAAVDVETAIGAVPVGVED